VYFAGKSNLMYSSVADSDKSLLLPLLFTYSIHCCFKPLSFLMAFYAEYKTGIIPVYKKPTTITIMTSIGKGV